MFIEQVTDEVLKRRFRNWDEVLKKLALIPAFEGISEDQINNILMVGDTIVLQSNEYLIRQNELDDNLYILLQGYLVVTREQENQEIYLAEISPIDVVGEASFFTKNPRNANVISMRDSLLIRLSRTKVLTNNLFLNFITNIGKINAKRLACYRSTFTLYKRKIKTITLVPSGDFKEIRNFSEKLFLSLSEHGKTLIEHVNDKQSSVTREQFMEDFFENESKYEYIINVLDNELTDISIRFINQTDHLIFVANENSSYHPNLIEQYIFKEKKYIHRKELVLVKHPNTIITTEVQNFISRRDLNGYYTLIDEKGEYSRLARCIIGKSTCLVLSGGGARGLAHIGTIKALQEKKISIDMIGGTSMGSVIAAAYARHLNYEDMLQVMKQFCLNYRVNKYTIPFISIFTGKNITDGFREVFGENSYIENLRCRYFCVACNLSRMNLKVFNTGLIWSAVRASFSIPAIFPPLINEEGEILVDGCVMNNLPVDQMELINNGGKIIASQIVQTSSIHRYESSDGSIKGSRLLINKLNPFAKKIDMPNLNFIFMKSLLISSQFHQQQMANSADYCIDHNIKRVGLFDFKCLEKIAEFGYQNTMNQLEKGLLDTLNE